MLATFLASQYFATNKKLSNYRTLVALTRAETLDTRLKYHLLSYLGSSTSTCTSVTFLTRITL
jgi:hypothetical protein